MLTRFTPVLGVLALIGLILAGYAFLELSKTNKSLTASEATASELGTKIASLENDNRALTEALDSERRRNEEFENDIEDLEQTVGKLDKLARTDAELLAKYSKVYFLNENYIPAKLTQITQKYIVDADDEFFQAQAWSFLKAMLDAAAKDNVDLLVASGYRSFDTQAVLKSGYRVTYGSGANTFSADQGYSEHQLGTAVDFSTKTTAGSLEGFQNTPAYAWLVKNAYKYGFILSYPANNAYYQYEPWHWRFVGEKLADDLRDDKKNFYDLDQRDIDKYLISLFD